MANYNFIGGDGISYGPYTVDQMRQFMAQNRLTAQSQVSADGGPWQPVGSFPEIAGSAAAPGPPMAQPGMPQFQGQQLKPNRGTLVLVLGILSLTFCGLFTGIPAWVMGKNDLKEMDQGTMDPSGRGLTNGGRICGMISSILAILCIGFYAIVILLTLIGGGM